jgi:hypothetical protein
MNVFEKHGITHLSPSSLNTYAAEPAYWAYKYLLGNPDPVGASAWRGSAVEAGLDYWLFKRDRGAAQKAALDRFELEAMGEITPEIDKERLVIFPMLDQAISALDGLEPPTVRQFDVEYWLDGIEVPIIGRIDYEWEPYGLDLKTTKRMPAGPRDYHARQVSFYSAARKKPYHLLYVTEKKVTMMDIDKAEAERHLKRLTWYAHNIRRGLATFSDKNELARIYRPDFTHIYWSRDESKALAKQIWEWGDA